MYVWYGTNEYNFETLENPPAFEPTHCVNCGAVISLSNDGYALKKGDYWCIPCADREMQEAMASERSSSSRPQRKPKCK